MGILLYEYAKNGNTYQFWYLLDQIYIIRFYLVHMGNITQIKLEVNTAADLSNSHRVFFGFDADSDVDRPQGREFRCRRNGSSDANPFRNGLKDITFGNGGNAEKANDNDPRNPQLDSDLVGRAYLRIAPNSSEEWKISSAKVTIDAGAGPIVLNLTLAPITLSDDAGEKTYFTPLT